MGLGSFGHLVMADQLRSREHGSPGALGHLGNRKTIAEIAESVELAASWQKTRGNGAKRVLGHLVI